MRIRPLMIACALFLPTQALAQNTSCITTGYGSMQHLWCNTTPAPAYDASSSYRQQSEANFGNSLAVLALQIKQQQMQAALARQQAEAQQAAAQRQAQDAQAEQAQMVQEVAAFRSAPGHERFDQMRPYMADLLRSGRATNLQDAYTLAVAEH